MGGGGERKTAETQAKTAETETKTAETETKTAAIETKTAATTTKKNSVAARSLLQPRTKRNGPLFQNEVAAEVAVVLDFLVAHDGGVDLDEL